MAEAITDLSMRESVYRSALAVGARVIQPSLVDFLR
jgi:flagellar hook-associated protein 3 FlgL